MFVSCCISRQFIIFSICRKILLSSAKSKHFVLIMSNKINSSGPRMEPCGTPEVEIILENLKQPDPRCQVPFNFYGEDNLSILL